MELLSLYLKCPDLLSRSLSWTDRNELQKQVLLEESEFELGIDTATACQQQHTSVINRIPPAEVSKTVSDINQGRALPLRAGDVNMTERLRSQIRQACSADYGKDIGWPSAFGNLPVQWCRKLAFTDR